MGPQKTKAAVTIAAVAPTAINIFSPSIFQKFNFFSYETLFIIYELSKE